MTGDKPEDYIALIAAEGVGPTIEFAVEECAELIVAAQHRRRGRPHNIAEEVADVMIMMERMTLFFPDAVKIKEDKMKKLEQSWRDGQKGNLRYLKLTAKEDLDG